MTDNSLWDEVLFHLKKSIGAIHIIDGSLSPGDSIEAIAKNNIPEGSEKLIVIGFSMGGYVARELARMVPEQVDKLILIATSARADTEEQRQQRLTAAKNMSATNFRGLSQGAIKQSIASSRENDRDLVERIRLMGAGLGKDVFVQQSGIHRTGDLNHLKDIQCPTLVIAAEEDRLRSLDEVRELHQGINGSEFRIIEQSGHMIPLEQAQVLVSAMSEWLVKRPN
jgi:pimeloyl-ACP methyl ester carboxylesterase